MVGSLGRFGILTELSFKVFPAPQSYQTLQVGYTILPAALQALTLLDQSPLELYALDLQPNPAGFTLWLRIGGLASALPGRMTRLQQFLTSQTRPAHLEILQDDHQHWQNFKALTWVNPAAYLLKIPLTVEQIEPLERELPPVCTRYYMAGGQLAWVATTQLEGVAAVLHQQGLTGLVVQGATPQLIFGKPLDPSFAGRAKKALDPAGRFLPLL
jgi:glycolate oxidase FAD binding subunit